MHQLDLRPVGDDLVETVVDNVVIEHLLLLNPLFELDQLRLQILLEGVELVPLLLLRPSHGPLQILEVLQRLFEVFVEVEIELRGDSENTVAEVAEVEIRVDVELELILREPLREVLVVYARVCEANRAQGASAVSLLVVEGAVALVRLILDFLAVEDD